ncbi:cytochrome p450 [Diplodia corticola]|uniref:Cytochrome p450 n=1 Tax=Diplodia corticola TaxID=236234 RepID=A0A1J9RBY8_9PEZI|nr:cytochrome p450 [Diplodia corticola]OJD29979.1 cytochrome p450 [Diplodia corticola]
MSSTAIFLGAFALLVLPIAGYVVYQVKLHPLAKHPGPFLAKLTNAYGAYHALKEDVHLEMWRCHQKYGDFVRWGPDRVLVNTASGMRDIYTSGKNVVKSRGYNALVHVVPSVLTIRDKKQASTRRRLLAEGLSDAALRSHEPIILTHVDRLCQVLGPADDVWSEPRNMAHWCSYLAFDIMSEVVFGQKYDLLGSPTHRYIVPAINGSNIRTTVLGYLPQLVWRRLDKKLFSASIKARNVFLAFMNAMLQARFHHAASCSGGDGLDGQRRDVFSALLKPPPPAEKGGEVDSVLNQYRIRSDSATLAIAATDTVSTALSTTLFYLSRPAHASALRLAAAEVRRAFPTRASIRQGTALTSCTYLRACIDESMRVTAPVGGALFREVGPGGVVVDGQWFPEGVDVGTGMYSIHRSGRYFERGERWEPERWLVDEAAGEGEERLKAMRGVFHPFSFGPRACLGKGMALAEILLTVARLLWEFEIEEVVERRDDGSDVVVGGGDPLSGPSGRRDPGEYQLYHGGITSSKSGPMLRFRRRVVAQVEAAEKEGEPVVQK